jgi:hypothetical protein
VCLVHACMHVCDMLVLVICVCTRECMYEEGLLAQAQGGDAPRGVAIHASMPWHLWQQLVLVKASAARLSFVATQLCPGVVPTPYLPTTKSPHQNEFDPSLGVDLVNAPLGWRDPRLSEEPASWLEGMRPLLDDYLAAQGERPTHDIEWKVCLYLWARGECTCTVWGKVGLV